MGKVNKERSSLQSSSQKLNKQLSKRSEQADDLQVGCAGLLGQSAPVLRPACLHVAGLT
jgi:hypothetical protein